MPAGLGRLEVNLHDLETRLGRAAEVPLSPEECQTLKAVVQTFARVLDLLDERGATIARLRELLGRSRTEKTRYVLHEAGIDVPERLSPMSGPRKSGTSPGHGRNGVAAYPGAQRIRIPHATLQPGDRCPTCLRGKVYAQAEPGILVRFVGQPPLRATVYEPDKLRCNLCGEIFTAAADGVAADKYAPTVASMIAVLKYGSGFPFNRLAQLQRMLRMPLPAATQWMIIKDAAARLQPVVDELIRQAAQGDVLHNDDTAMKILAFKRNAPRDEAEPHGRTGVFTSGIVASAAGHQIALFFTGRRHAGENLATVLARRAAALGPPIQVCDAVARNIPKAFEVILGHCLAHARRRFVDVTPNFPEECRYVLETLGAIYHHDQTVREQRQSPEDRLRYHQLHSGPMMTDLHVWLTAQLAEQRVEPNSGLGRAITYLLNHWDPLTLFLRQPGAPLDNNVVERALKRSILHRKNALFYKTANGAQVGDLFMSLVHTCELCGVNAFEYLTELQRHATELPRDAGRWLPWTYRDTLAQAGRTG